jgi:hypothetical protein
MTSPDLKGPSSAVCVGSRPSATMSTGSTSIAPVLGL